MNHNMKRVLFLAVPLLVLSSCQMELEQISEGSDSEISEPSIVFHASTESYSTPETRIYADENMKVLWNADDRISIFEKTTYNYQYKFLGEDGETAGDFDKVATSGFHTGGNVDYYYAAYPYRTSNKLSNSGVFTMVLPSEQTYKENSFGIGSNTMVAVSDGDFLAFKNVCGYLSISLYGDNVSVSKVTIQGKNGEKIAGKASISIPFGGLPETTMDGSATESITIECNPALKIGGSSDECTTFWFAIPPVTFSGGITLTIVDDQGGVCTKSASKEIKVERNKLSWMSALKVTPKYATVSFADPEFESYCLENFDANDDGKITSNEATAVKSIDVCTDEISSLGGVEAFTNLESLKCTGSEIATRSVEDYAGQLETLDVSALALLEELDCHGNKLETLDVSKNPELETLICTDNPMSEIKMAVGQEITDLECPEDTQIVYEWGDGLGADQFPDEAFRDYVFVNFDTDGDGFLSDEECNAVTSIELVTDEIESLEGIEFFPNLESLCAYASVVHNDYINGCYGTGILKALDVSNNLLLKTLRVEGNKLTSIDVSKNTQLEYFHVSANLLTELDLSHNGELKNLQCIGNNLSGLDLSGNPKITGLGCVSCGLTALDLSANTEIQNVACSYNQISDLDISSCTALKILSVNNNCLTSLDVTRNNALTSLHCSNNPDLATVFVLAGQEINIRKDEATEIVEIVPIEDPVFMNYLQQFDGDGDGRISSGEALDIKAIKICNENVTSIKGIEFMPNLTVLECVQTNLQSVDISNNPLLTIVNFNSKYDPNPDLVISWSFHSGGSIRFTPQYKNNLTTLDVSSNPAITWLDCTGNGIAILDLSNNSAITDLDCAKNKLSSLDVSSMPNLYWLDCNENDLEVINVSNNPILNEIHCSDNNLSSLDLSNNPKLNTLECSGNKLTALDLSRNPMLVNLTIRSNRLSSLDVSACPALVDIYVSDNMLSSIDISNNPNLKWLDFSSNQVSSFDFSGNPILETLRCGSNPIANFDISANTNLKELDCSDLQLNYLDISNLTELTTLNCGHNNLSSLGLEANTKLTSLTVSYNRLESLTLSGCPSLKWFMCENNLLTSLDVSNNPSLWTLRCSPMDDSNGNNLLATIYIATGQTINNLTKPESTIIVEK